MKPSKRSIIGGIVLVAIGALIWFLLGWNASRVEAPAELEEQMVMIENTSLVAISPMPKVEVIKVYYVIATAYNAVPEQTDDTPFITATGDMVEEGIVAANWLPFGTLLRIDGKIYEVKDRMNSEYGFPHIDLFMWSLEEAKEFGAQKLKVELIN